jgi:nucleoid-associated protein YgaU
MDEAMSRDGPPKADKPQAVSDEEAIRTAVAALARQLGPGATAPAPEGLTEPVPESDPETPADPSMEMARAAPAGSSAASTRRVTIRRPAGGETAPADDEDVWVVPGSPAAAAETRADVTTRSGAPTRVQTLSEGGGFFRPSRWIPGLGVLLLVAVGSYWLGHMPGQRALETSAPMADSPPPAARRAPAPAANAPAPSPAPADSASPAAPTAPAAPPTPSRPAPADSAAPATPTVPATPSTPKPDAPAAGLPGVPPAPAGTPPVDPQKVDPQKPATPDVRPEPPATGVPPAAVEPGAPTGTDGSKAPSSGTPQGAVPAGTPAAPSFDIARVTPDGRAVIAGRAAPGSRITVLDGEREVTTVQVDPHGEWVLVIDSPPLPPGAHDLRLVQRRDGGDIVRSDRTITVDIPAAASAAAPGTGGVAPMRPGTPQAVTATGAPLVMSVPAGGGPTTVLQAPGGTDALARSGELVLGAIDYDEAGHLTVSGQAPAGTTVRVYVDNGVVGDATANADGRWALQPPGSVVAGRRTVRVDRVSPSGGVVSRLEVPFERVTMTRPGVVTIVRGDNLWNIAHSQYGDGARYTVIYEANKSQIRDPNLIYPGQIFVVPKNP